jgi:hypothetical protein
MAFAAIKVIITNVDTGSPMLTIRTLDGDTGGFHSTSQEIAGQDVGKLVAETLEAHTKTAQRFAQMQRAEELAMSKRNYVE